MEQIILLVKKYWSILSYLFFGVVTTVVNMAVYYVGYHVCGLSSDLSTVIAWVLAVLTAFLTNKPFVFAVTTGHPRCCCRRRGAFSGAALDPVLWSLR